MNNAFWSKVRTVDGDGCWLWQASVDGNGYGKFWDGSRLMRASRVAFMWACGIDSLPSAVYVCHRCDTPLCVNPDHLFLGSARDNSADCKAKGRMPLGATRAHAKLSEPQVHAIRRRLALGDPHRRIALDFGVCAGTISKISRGQKWAFLTAEHAQAS